MTKPGGSAAFVMPVLQLSPAAAYAYGSNNTSSAYSDLPGVMGIDPEKFNLYRDCTCTTCDCYFPYQAETLNYEAVHLQNSNQTSWWIAIFNNLPWTGPNSSSNYVLQLRCASALLCLFKFVGVVAGASAGGSLA